MENYSLERQFGTGISVVGSEPFLYTAIKNWLTTPEGVLISDISSVAVNASNLVHVFNRGPNPVAIFKQDGSYVNSWGNDILADAHGISINSKGEVYLGDRDAHQILKCTHDGTLLMALGSRNLPALESPFNHPTDVFESPSGDIFVSDGYANSRVHHFSADGQHIKSWGKRGTGPGEFNGPHSIWADSDRVYVSDRENGRIQIFDYAGIFIEALGGLYRPTDIYRDQQGNLFVTELVPRLTVFDKTGTKVAVARLEGTPHGVWGDSDGNLYIASTTPSNITKLEKN